MKFEGDTLYARAYIRHARCNFASLRGSYSGKMQFLNASFIRWIYLLPIQRRVAWRHSDAIKVLINASRTASIIYLYTRRSLSSIK